MDLVVQEKILLRCNLKSLRNHGIKYLAIQSSVVAAIFLDEGKNVHSNLEILLEVNDTITCKFGPRCKISQLPHDTQALIWDESLMASRFAIEAFNKTMNDT
jgi:hypothetical protein